MSLRDELERIAEAAPPLTVPSGTWSQARVARRRDAGLAAAAGAAVVAVVAVITALVPGADQVAPAGRPAPGPGLPARIVPATSRPTTDLTTGRAVIAYVDGAGRAVVVRYDDGASRVLDLPDRDGPVALAPDGTRLAWSTVDATGSSLRVVDLTTGTTSSARIKIGRLRDGVADPVHVDTLAWDASGVQLLYTGRAEAGTPTAGYLRVGSTVAPHVEVGGARLVAATRAGGPFLAVDDRGVVEVRKGDSPPRLRFPMTTAARTVGACARGFQYTVLRRSSTGEVTASSYDVRLGIDRLTETPSPVLDVPAPTDDLSVLGCLPSASTMLADRLLVRRGDQLAVLTLTGRPSYDPVSTVSAEVDGPVSVAGELLPR